MVGRRYRRLTLALRDRDDRRVRQIEREVLVDVQKFVDSPVVVSGEVRYGQLAPRYRFDEGSLRSRSEVVQREPRDFRDDRGWRNQALGRRLQQGDACFVMCVGAIEGRIERAGAQDQHA